MRIGLLITARLKSSRLPFKLLKELNGYSIIEHVIERSKKVSNIDKIILCTSNNPQDRPLVEIAQKRGVFYFLGSEVDVLQRLEDCASFYGLDAILSITGENPLFSIDFTQQVIDRLENKNADFVYTSGLPIGCAVYGLNNKALKLVCSLKKEIDTEIWGPLINRPTIFNVEEIIAPQGQYLENIRLTNDYPEDFQMMTKIFSYFPFQTLPSLEAVMQLLKSHPEILEINQHCVQKGLEPDMAKRIDDFYEQNFEKIKKLKEQIYSTL